MAHDRIMLGSHPSFARRVHRWLDRCGRAFVMEIELGDGSHALVALDPHWHGAPAIALGDTHAVGGEDEDGRWADGIVVPDDLRDLVP